MSLPISVHQRNCLSLTIVLLLVLVSLPLSATASTNVVLAGEFNDWEQFGTDWQQPLVIQDLQLADGTYVDLELDRSSPFDDGARVRINGQDLGAVESNRVHFRGGIVGQPGSVASLSVGPEGDVHGALAGDQGSWILHNHASAPESRQPGLLQARFETSDRPDTETAHDHFECGNEHKPDTAEFALDLPEYPRSVVPEVQRAPRNDDRYLVRVAFESDYSFYNLFGNAADAQDYLGDLINFISGIYENDLNTELAISSISLWDSPSQQPWQHTDHAVALCLLAEFGIFWNDPANNVDDERTIAHFVTADPNPGSPVGRDGVAWRGTLCRGPDEFLPFDFDEVDGVDCYSGQHDDVIGDFGVSRGIASDFEIGNAPGTWDYNVVAHEIGHNFDSKHTHCYGIDQCAQEGGCYSGPTSLPGPGGEGSGTIMSYCHTLAPGLDNISPTLGRDHPWGNNPDQVPDIMRDHVVEQGVLHSANPRCPELIDPGNVYQLSVTSSGGSNVVINSSTGHGGTTNYSLTVGEGETIELTAPNTSGGNDFDGWSGCDQTSGTNCTILSISTDTDVTASYSAPEHTLSVNSSGTSGVPISSTPSGFGGTTDYSVQVNEGTTVELSAPSGAGGLQYDGWAGCDSVVGSTCTVNVDSSRSVTAQYIDPPEIDEPEINVNPGSLSTTLDPGESETLNLQIANSGDGSLNWGIEAALAGVAPETPSERQGHEFTLAGQPVSLDRASPIGTNTISIPCTDPDASGMLVNDDGIANAFWPPNEGFLTTYVEGFHVEESGLLTGVCAALMAGNAPVGESYTFDIVAYDDSGPGGQPGNLLLSGSVTFSGVADQPHWFQINTLNAGLRIDAGTVYIGVRLPWHEFEVGIMGDHDGPGSEGSYVTLGGDWIDAQSLDSDHNAFIIRGRVLGGCELPSEVGWLDVAPSSGSIAAGGQSNVDVIVDNSGLSQGVYEALLCIESNDPDQPVLEVPVSLEVTGPILFHDRFED